MVKVSEYKLKWIMTGYTLFGEIGTEALNIEKLSIIMGLNRSSFNHYFGDIELFETDLLMYHLERYENFGEIIKDYDKFELLFTDEVYDHLDALAFQRQLMINQGIFRYKQCHDDSRLFPNKIDLNYGLCLAKSKSN